MNIYEDWTTEADTHNEGYWNIVKRDKGGMIERDIARFVTGSDVDLIISAPAMYRALDTIVHAIQRDCFDRGEMEFTFHRNSPLANTLREALAMAKVK